MTSWTSKFTIEGSPALCVHYTRGWEGRTYLYGNKTLFQKLKKKCLDLPHLGFLGRLAATQFHPN